MKTSCRKALLISISALMVSVLQAQDLLHIKGGEMQLETDATQTYFLKSSVDLETWSFTGDWVLGSGSTVVYPIDFSVEQQFFRYVMNPTNVDNPDDTDGDGLSNDFELQYFNGTYSPTNAYSTSADTSDGELDPDNDGKSNSEEENDSGDPTNSADGDYGIQNTEINAEGEPLKSWSIKGEAGMPRL